MRVASKINRRERERERETGAGRYIRESNNNYIFGTRHCRLRVEKGDEKPERRERGA